MNRYYVLASVAGLLVSLNLYNVIGKTAENEEVGTSLSQGGVDTLISKAEVYNYAGETLGVVDIFDREPKVATPPPVDEALPLDPRAVKQTVEEDVESTPVLLPAEEVELDTESVIAVDETVKPGSEGSEISLLGTVNTNGGGMALIKYLGTVKSYRVGDLIGDSYELIAISQQQIGIRHIK